MIKYLDTAIVFQEVPNEVTLAINITNCPCQCKGCHSSYLAADIGKPLNWKSLKALIHTNRGITCVAFMGGDSDPKSVNKLAKKVQEIGLLTCWYSGRQELSQEIDLENFSFIKLGPYIEELGPLTNETTNQRFYEIQLCNEYIANAIYPIYGLYDITNYFWKK